MGNKYYIIVMSVLEASGCSYYYISNTNPIIYTKLPFSAKKYVSSKNAEYEILKDYDNYMQIKQMINGGQVLDVSIAEIEGEAENRRIKIL